MRCLRRQDASSAGNKKNGSGHWIRKNKKDNCCPQEHRKVKESFSRNSVRLEFGGLSLCESPDKISEGLAIVMDVDSVYEQAC